MSDIILKQAATVSALPDSDTSPFGSFEVILSTPTRDRDGEEVKSSEWQMPLPDHITFDVDHGMSVMTTVGSGVPSLDEQGRLVVRGTYASTDLAQQTRALVNEGHIRTVSVAFMRKTLLAEDGTKTTVRELLNGAFVAIPANPEAVIMASKAADMPMTGEPAETETLADQLREILAGVFAFYVQAHAAHWNVVGPDFTEWHDLFGEIYADAYGSIDPLAENIRKIGSLAPSGLADMVSIAGLEPAEPTSDALELARNILEANTSLIEDIVEAFNCATACGEQGIANFLADRQDSHAKWSWQLSASLGIQTLDGAPAGEQAGPDGPESDENPQTSNSDAAVVTAAANAAAATSAADDEESVQVLARALQLMAGAH